MAIFGLSESRTPTQRELDQMRYFVDHVEIGKFDDLFFLIHSDNK
jgi:hypothetical protein